jgi:hypothetical protein
MEYVHKKKKRMVSLRTETTILRLVATLPHAPANSKQWIQSYLEMLRGKREQIKKKKRELKFKIY